MHLSNLGTLNLRTLGLSDQVLSNQDAAGSVSGTKGASVQLARRPVASSRTYRLVAAGLVILVATGVGLVAQARRDFDVVARRYSFTVSGSDRAEIHVAQNDLVRVNFSTEDIPHSFTIEDHDDSHYRIMRRAEAGKPVSFEFRADAAGRFRFYCSLTTDPKCKGMSGTLIVDPK